MEQINHEQQLKKVLSIFQPPSEITLPCRVEADFPAIQSLSAQEAWPTPCNRPEEARQAWQQSWPALVITEGEVEAYLTNLAKKS